MPFSPYFPLFLLTASLVFVGHSPAETLELVKGQRVEVKLLRAEETGAQIEFQGVNRLVPWVEIKSIQWASVPEETAALEALEKGSPLVKVMDLWTAKKPWLARPNADAGKFGLAFASHLAKRTNAEDRQRARDVFSLIAQQDWEEPRRVAATLGRMSLDLMEGQAAVVEQEIAKFSHTVSVTLAIESRHLLATHQAAALLALQKEHPKWQEEEDITPQRQALFQSVEDHLLYPVLFQGAEEKLCRRNLSQLAAFYDQHGEKAKATATRVDLARLYPEVQKGT